MKDGKFVFDCHTGFWDASQDNCKNQYGEAFIETFYAFHNGFNPAGQSQWTMDYEGVVKSIAACRAALILWVRRRCS